MEVRDDLPLLKKIIVIDMKGLRNYNDPMIIGFDDVEKMGREVEVKDPEVYYRLLDQVQSNDVAIMVYTSGTTGPPKGAMITHHNVLAIAPNLMKIIPQYDTDEVVSYLPLCHVAERMMSVCMPLYSGATVNFAESVDTVTMAMRRNPAHVLFCRAAHLGKDDGIGDYQNERRVVDGKEPFSHGLCPWARQMAQARLDHRPIPFGLNLLYGLGYLAVFRHLKKELGLLRTPRGIQRRGRHFAGSAFILPFPGGSGVLEGWGQTEETGLATVTPPDTIKLGTVGPALPGVEIKIADDGEILLRCEHVFKGYWKDPEATANTIVDGWLYTGDVGELDEDGVLKITDRKKEIIITSGGKNISPSEIEKPAQVQPVY